MVQPPEVAFFFIIGGVSPKVIPLDAMPRRCPQCGWVRVHQQRVDHYFSLFFIPLFKVKTGEPFWFCEHCQMPVRDPAETAHLNGPSSGPSSCRACGASLHDDYRFCPFCGAPVE